jgi:hypothetical protein
MDDEIGTSVVCLGVLGVSTDLLRRAEVVNTAKLKFKAICTPLQGIRIRIPVKGTGSPTKAIPALRVILRNIQRGLGMLSPKPVDGGRRGCRCNMPRRLMRGGPGWRGRRRPPAATKGSLNRGWPVEMQACT